MAGKLLSRPGKRYRFRELEFWAERGLVHIVDTTGDKPEPDYKVVPVKQMLVRLRALNAALPRIAWSDERNENQNLIDDMIACCREAKAQGSPDFQGTWDHIDKLRSKDVLHADKPRGLIDPKTGEPFAPAKPGAEPKPETPAEEPAK